MLYSLFRNAPWKCWCLGASTKPKRCLKVLEDVLKCSQYPFLLEVSLLVFCPRQFSGWCSGQPLGLARGQHGRPECDLPTLPCWRFLRFIPKCYWCRSLENYFSEHCLARPWGARHLRESQQWGISGDQGHPASRRVCESSLCWWAADGREGKRCILFWTTGYVWSLQQA